jgi:hypothetical protein
MNAMPASAQSASGLIWRWLTANLVVAIVGSLLVSISYELFDVDYSDLSEIGSNSIFAVMLPWVSGVVTYTLFGFLTASVLGRGLQPFPRKRWIGLHATFGVLLGTAGAMALLSALPGTVSLSPAQQRLLDDPTQRIPHLSRVLILGAILAAIGGAIVGSLQARVLGTAAANLSGWVFFSVLASVAFVSVHLVFSDIELFGSPHVQDAVGTARLFIEPMAWALMMVPAVRRLPR